MGTRGRKSGDELTIIGAGGVVTVHRPDAPGELTDEQAAEWRAVVNHMPADWFSRETHGMLVQLCRHRVAARRVAQLVAQCETAPGDFDVSDFDRLLKMQERESRAIATLAVKMRIAQSTTIRADKARRVAPVHPPWES